jgi:hypothetical protein
MKPGIFRTQKFKFLRILIVLPLLATTEPNCAGVSKRSDAIMDGSASGVDYLSTCASAASFVSKAEPALQNRCIGCHAAGGSAGSDFVIVAGSSLSNGQLNANYGTALHQLLTADGGDPTKNPILLRPLGNLSHSTIFTSTADTDASGIYGWIQDERSSPCH